MTDVVLSNEDMYGPLERALGDDAMVLKAAERLDLVTGLRFCNF